MTWQEIGAVETQGTRKGFLDAIEIWRKKPHVVNRRLSGAHQLWSDSFALSDDQTLHDCIIQLLSLRRLLLGNGEENRNLEVCLKKIQETFLGISSNSADIDGMRWMVAVRSLIHKQEKYLQKTIEVLIIDEKNLEGIFLPFCGTDGEKSLVTKVNDFGYKISLELKCKKISLHLCNAWNVDVEFVGSSYSSSWLTNVLLNKLARWSEEKQLNTELTSLRLVSVERYTQVYHELKIKYGKHFVEIWPEHTDPSKFVYEDIGIAAYLLVLWEMERKMKGLTSLQSFVDIGCGNGLLVYLLASEGHPGMGIDIRKRKIWELLSDVADLKEYTLNPSDESVFPNHDWLIGNHSDELTPWIPVIAARSHYNCCYFVVPCCAWDFGKRFSCKSKGIHTSQYHSYLEFVSDVGNVCGFKVEQDTLRIPSTKRVCFIGMERSYPASDEISADLQRADYIEKRCQSGPTKSPRVELTTRDDTHPNHDDKTMLLNLDKAEHVNGHVVCNEPLECPESRNSKQSADKLEDQAKPKRSTRNNLPWLETFQPRIAIEKPKNAVCLQQSIKDFIAVKVLNRILKSSNTVTLSEEKEWNLGGVVSLNEVSQLFDRDVLLQLKNECGGLQTLLKNCPDVFIVRDGNIGLRDWTSKEYFEYRASRNKKRRKSAVRAEEVKKTKLCFFFQHHPDGCPLDSRMDCCRFAHGLSDLRQLTEMVQVGR